MEAALRAGYDILERRKGSSLDAVEAAIRVLEDSPHFNAGRGAVFTSAGTNELDASIMEGSSRRAGAVASVTVIKNPITAARAVMEKTRHVMLVGRGAEEFARSAGLELVGADYFRTERRLRQLEEWKRTEAEGQRGEARPRAAPEWGTVGAVARDRKGDLAAGTSTGGMTGKRWGRVGDSPVIGAGTYADNATCAVSATGHGEYFIRYSVAHDISALMAYKGLSPEQAAEEVVNVKLKSAGGEGAVIVLDRGGRFAAARNSETLYRGYATRDGRLRVLLFE